MKFVLVTVLICSLAFLGCAKKPIEAPPSATSQSPIVNVTPPAALAVPPPGPNEAPTIFPRFDPLRDKSAAPPAGIGGWPKPRPLTDAEKARVVGIAVNVSASAWLKGRTDYRVSGVDWYAAIWHANDQPEWWHCSYDIIDKGIPGYVNPYGYWYPGVTIAVGQPGNLMQMQIAVDLDNGKTAFVDGPYPPPGQGR